MSTVKVTFDNGNSVITGINGSVQDIEAYFIGRQFNLGDGDGGDAMATALKVEFLHVGKHHNTR